MGYLKKVGTVFIYVAATLAFITFLPGLPPDVEFAEYSIAFSKKLEGELTEKGRLNDAELLYAGELRGAESFDSYDGQLYSGLSGGYVVRFEGSRIVPVVKFGKKCDGMWQEQKCGRPLGLKFDRKGTLFVTDTYYGIFKVDVKTGKYSMLVDPTQPIDGKVPQVFNSLDVAENGDIFWTDSSTDFKLHDGVYAMLANPSGRLIRYNAATKKNEVLLTNLAFPNGIKLSEDESFLVVGESVGVRILKYHLKGPKAGKVETFRDALPGHVDNIHGDGAGGFLVGLIGYIHPERPDLLQTIIPHPYIRKMLARLLKCIEMPFILLQDFYPNTCSEKLIYMIGSFQIILPLVETKATIVRFDANGKTLEVADTTNERVSSASSGFAHNNYLWLGSPFTEYVARVPLKRAFPGLAQTLASQPVQRKQVHASQSAPPQKPATKQTPKATSPPPVTKPSNTQGSRAESEQVRKPREAKVAETAKPATKPVVKPQTTAPPTTTPTPTTQTPKPTKKPIPKAAPTTTTTSAPTTTTPRPTPKPTPKPTAKPTPKPTVKPTAAPTPTPKAPVNAKTQGAPTKEAKKETGKVETPKTSPPTKKSETNEKKPAIKQTDAKPKQTAETAKPSRQSTESTTGKQTQGKNRPADEF